MSTTFQRAADGTFPSGFAYIRDANPNRRALEAAVAALEGGASAVAVASGMAGAEGRLPAAGPGADEGAAPRAGFRAAAGLLRPLGRDGRGGGGSGGESRRRAAALDAGPRGSGAVALRLVAGPPGHSNATVAHARALQQRRGRGGILVGAASSRARPLPWASR